MSMNIFRLAGDICHIISILLLLLRLQVSKNAMGISMKTQELYLIVFVARYLDLFTVYVNLYNTVMKILYISTTAFIIYLVRYTEPFKSVYEASHDSFLHWKFAVAPCAIASLVTIYLYDDIGFMEFFYTGSLYLEALAIVPQLIILQRYREVENLTGHYVFFLGAYRLLYIFNWIYRAYTEAHYHHNYVIYGCAVLQTILYVDFFYYYVKSKYSGGKFALPA